MSKILVSLNELKYLRLKFGSFNKADNYEMIVSSIN
jgi:hypothetical protein